MRALQGLLASEGVRELRLDVFAANEPALRLYAAAGSEPVGAARSGRQPRTRLSDAV